MNTSDIWLANFRAVVDAEIRNADGHRATAYRTVAEKLRVLKSDFVYQIYMGKPAEKPKRPSITVMERLALVYANGRPGQWINVPPSEMAIFTLDRPESKVNASSSTPTIAQALEVLAVHLDKLDVTALNAAAKTLQILVYAPDSAKAKTSVLEALTSPPSAPPSSSVSAQVGNRGFPDFLKK